jgi:two-component system, chemotaxis family, CheB/CheR fusion protein
VFSKRPVTAPPLELPSFAPRGAARAGPREEATASGWSALDVQREADRVVLARYAPVGVVIDESMTVVQFRGRTAPYLEPAPGMASLDLLRMLREGLLGEVRAAVTRAKAENAPVAQEGLRVLGNGGPRQVKVEVIPFKLPASGARFFVVLFSSPGAEAAPAAPAPAPAAARAPADGELAQTQHELASLREYLQSVIEEKESANEELKSANEEILSANEELQSTNEELQTAKEEAQSANEELITVNEELRQRNAELARVNNDLVNFLGSANIPIVMVSRDLRVRRFTPLAEKVFNLIPTDPGRPISDIKHNLQVADLIALLTEVIDTLRPHESEVQDRAGHWYTLRVRPYITLDQKIDGASIVLLDIDAVKRSAHGAEGDGEAGAGAAGSEGGSGGGA